MFNRIQVRWSLWPFPTKPFSVYACFQLCSFDMKSRIMENCLQRVTGRSSVFKETLDLCSTDHLAKIELLKLHSRSPQLDRSIMFLSGEFCLPYWQIADDYWSGWPLELVRMTVTSKKSMHTILAWAGIAFDSCTDSHILYSGTMNSVRYNDDIGARYAAVTGVDSIYLSYCLNSQRSHHHSIFRIWITISYGMTITITWIESHFIYIRHAMETFIFIHWPASEHFWTISVSFLWLSADIQNCHGWS